MNATEFRTASHYRNILLSNPDAQDAFIADPIGELAKNAGMILTPEESQAVMGFVASAKQLHAILIPIGNGPWDPGPNDPAARKAPRWLHWLLDVIWDYFSE